MAGSAKVTKKAPTAKAKSGAKAGAKPAPRAKARGKPAPGESAYSVRPVGNGDREWIPAFIAERWGSPIVVSHGSVYRPEKLQGFVAESNGVKVGLATFRVEGRRCELVTIDAVRRTFGIGTALLEAVKEEAVRSECTRLWLVVTNDNLDALRFFQRRGLELTRVYRGAVVELREFKPEIPLVGYHGIPVRDELELELRLAAPS